MEKEKSDLPVFLGLLLLAFIGRIILAP